MKELTTAEEQVMHILWDLKKGFVKDIIDKMPDPKPAYNTVSTIVRILQRKGFVSYKAYGKTHEYYPVVLKDEYRRFSLKNLMKGYFGGSFERLVSFFAKDNDLNIQELEQIMQYVEKDLKNKKDGSGR